jgi:hypothetical protein
MIIIVSGLPRSGTSMLMNILKENSIEILEDKTKEADEYNPKGYFEFQPVSELPEGNITWLEQAEGKAVKVTSYFLHHLPAKYEYKVLFMERKIEEIVKSQQKTVAEEGKKFHKKEIKMMEDYFQDHIKQTKTWISLQPNFTVRYLSYNRIIENPKQFLPLISEFLELELKEESFTKIVDSSLYKERVK